MRNKETQLQGTFQDYLTMVMMVTDIFDKMDEVGHSISDMPYFMSDKEAIKHEREIFHNIDNTFFEFVEALTSSLNLCEVLESIKEELNEAEDEEYRDMFKKLEKLTRYLERHSEK